MECFWHHPTSSDKPDIASSETHHVRNLLIILGIGLVMVTLAWVGYAGTDDQSYARGALGWLEKFPYVGDSHWALRHTVVIPLAMSLAIFGYREISLALPSAFFFFVFLGANYYYLQRFFDNRFGLLVTVFLATTPLFVVYATFAQTVVVETLFMSVSFWLFYSATQTRKPNWPMFVSGVALGLGFLTRETAVALVLFYSVLFVFGIGLSRRYYWIMALGFLLVVGVEMSYFSALTGDPFYRYHIDANYHDMPASRLIFGRRRGDVLMTSGDLAAGGRIFQPILSLLFNQEFGLFFWVSIPAAVWACWSNSGPAKERRLLRLLTGLGLIWMVFISYSRLLAPIARFYTLSLWAAIIVVMCWVRRVYEYRPKTAIFLGLSLLATNMLCIYVENKNPVFGERVLVADVLQHNGVVYTDPRTLRLGRLLLEFKGVSNRVRSDPVPPGGLFYFNKSNIDFCYRYGCPYSWKDYVPKTGWKVVMRIEPERKLSGILLRSVGLDKIIPASVFERLDMPNSAGILYERPLNESASSSQSTSP